jgi:phosphate uptake regulator
MKPQVRKVQKLGLSSLGISLPKGWLQDLGVEAGSTVVVQQDEEGALRITTEMPGAAAGSQECVLDADKCHQDGYLERLILASYMVGCNTIRVKSRGELDAGQIEEVQRALAKVTGVTPVDQGSKHLTLENFAEPSKFPVEGLLRRLHFLTSRIQGLAFQMVLDQRDLRDQIRAARDEVERLYTFAIRQLLLAARDPTIARQIGLNDPRQIGGDRAFAMLMTNIADGYLEIAEAWVSPEAHPSVAVVARELAAMRTGLDRLAEIAIGAYFGKDMERANEALDQMGQLLPTIQGVAAKVSLPREMEGPAYCTTCLLSQAILRPLQGVVRLYGSVAQVAMNRGLEESLRRGEARTASVPPFNGH